ncbi:MAG: chemotaxis protein CheW [Clostridium sp.]|nr:chemotaxis protein CheW [Clostridium sp.]
MSEIRILVFKLNGEYFATDIMEVERILGNVGSTKLPDSPDFLEGIIKYEEEIIPVINLYKKFNFNNCTVDSGNKIIVVKNEKGKFGVIVDDVNEVTTVNEESIEYSTSVSTIVSKKYMKGIIREKKNLIMLLDLNSVLLEKEEEVVFKRME